MIADSTKKTTGDLHIKLVAADGTVKTEFDHKNLVVQTGLNLIAQRMANSSTATVSHMATGTGSIATSAGDTSLGAELARTATTVSSVTNNVTTWSATFSAGTGTGNLTELGLFNTVSGGTMVARTVFPVVAKGTSDTLYVTWAVTFN